MLSKLQDKNRMYKKLAENAEEMATSNLARLLTWKTVKRLEGKESKLLLGLECKFESESSFDLRRGNLPPKTWVPRRAKIPRNKNSRTRRDTMASILLMSEARRFCNDLQYLEKAS